MEDILTREEWNKIEYRVIKYLRRSIKYCLQGQGRVQAPNGHAIVNEWMGKAANTMRQALQRRIDVIPRQEDGNDVTLDMIIAFLEQKNYSHMQLDLTTALNQLQDDRAWMMMLQEQREMLQKLQQQQQLSKCYLQRMAVVCGILLLGVLLM